VTTRPSEPPCLGALKVWCRASGCPPCGWTLRAFARRPFGRFGAQHGSSARGAPTICTTRRALCAPPPCGCSRACLSRRLCADLGVGCPGRADPVRKRRRGRTSEDVRRADARTSAWTADNMRRPPGRRTT